MSEPLNTDDSVSLVFNLFTALIFVCFAGAKAIVMAVMCVMIGSRKVDTQKKESGRYDLNELFI